MGRNTQELDPTITIDQNGTATTLRPASWAYYDDANHVTYTGQGFQSGIGPGFTYTLMNPVSVTQTDAQGRLQAQIQAASTTTSGTLITIINNAGSGAAAFPQSTHTRWTTLQYTDCCLVASQRVYKLIPTSGTGSSGTNYDESDFGYDIMKRPYRTVTPGGTITDLVYDPRGNVIGTYVGTNDTGATPTDPTGGGAHGNNMVLVTTNVFDGNAAGGDGNLTAVIQHVDSTTTRTTTNVYDFRDRLIAVDGEINYYAVYYYDNMDRTIEVQRYDTTGPYAPSGSSSSSGPTTENLIAQSVTNYDDRSQVYQTITYAVNPATGAVGNSLTDNFWFDASGNQVKAWPAGSQLFTKTTFDSLGRPTVVYSGNGADSNYAAVLTVSNNTIVEQTETVYDNASNVIQINARQRYHNAPTTQLGALQNPSLTPNARVTYMARRYESTTRCDLVHPFK